MGLLLILELPVDAAAAEETEIFTYLKVIRS
jgi:hypothetical protein